MIDGNPAGGKRRRARERRPVRSHLDAAQPIKALLDAAGELDREARHDRRHVERRAMLAVLIFAGLWINELCALRWRDVDLDGGWLSTGSKTDVNLAQEDLPPPPDKLTPHSLRRTCCTLLYALSEDPGVVMDEMGHADPGLALRVYRQSMRRGEGEKA